jgi:UDP-N-acetylmuramyl pentapeptide phosphotransferase/UDP-N-acetylglucosamine-1-phosphate transferase
MAAARFGGSPIKEALDPADPEPTMTESPRESASRIVSILLACLAAIIGFFAFNVVDGVFGLVQAILGLAACIATTVFVFRRSPPGAEDTDA